VVEQAPAQPLNLWSVTTMIKEGLGTSEGRYHFAALYPLPSWQPANGYTVDRALVYSIMRAESAFDPSVESHAGAQGLMQVMPETARDIAARGVLQPPQADDLFEPETSIQFGQAYLEYLLQWSPIGTNLIYVAAAYNAGPGRVTRWRDRLGIDTISAGGTIACAMEAGYEGLAFGDRDGVLRALDEMARVRAAVPSHVRLVANMVEQGRTPLRTADALARAGYDIVVVPVTGVLAAARALEAAYGALARDGASTAVAASLMGFDELNALLDLDPSYRH